MLCEERLQRTHHVIDSAICEFVKRVVFVFPNRSHLADDSADCGVNLRRVFHFCFPLVVGRCPVLKTTKPILRRQANLENSFSSGAGNTSARSVPLKSFRLQSSITLWANVISALEFFSISSRTKQNSSRNSAAVCL